MSSDELVVGIDLGTTNSLVAVLEGATPTLIPNALGELLTPSVVSIDDDGHILVGAPARARLVTHPKRTARAFKRDMGTSRLMELEGHAPMSAEQLSSFVLLSLRQDAEAFLGRPVKRAVITVPAYFGELQRQATKDAAVIAGLEVERIINEPTAAALAYGLENRDARMRAVVLDLGGGTFDVTVLEIDDGVIEIRSSAGDARLGGEDFTDAIAVHLVTRIGERHGRVDERSHHTMARVRELAESAKRALSTAESARVSWASLEVDGRPTDVEIVLSREEVVRVVGPWIERLRAPIHRALRNARMLPSAVHEVLLVGGATRMPWVVRLAHEVFQRAPLDALPPDEAVALGAAIQGALYTSNAAVDDLVVTDVAPFSLGIETGTKHGDVRVHGMFTPILERGTVIPASRVQRFFTFEDDQEALSVRVYQGEHSLTRDNTLLGTVTVTDLPKASAGACAIDVRLTYNLDGILDVDVEVVGTRTKHELVIERNTRSLTQAQVDSARRAMASLKFHPRDSLPNRTALARAESAYVEVRGAEREHLGRLIAAFRSALERQDPVSIEPMRVRLTDFVRALGQG